MCFCYIHYVTVSFIGARDLESQSVSYQIFESSKYFIESPPINITI